MLNCARWINAKQIDATSTALTTSNAVATSIAVSLVGGSVAGADSSTEITSPVEAYASESSTLSAGQNITVGAMSNFTADVDTSGISFSGSNSIGTSITDVNMLGATKAYIEGEVTTANDMDVLATGIHVADANSQVFAAAFFSGAVGDASAIVDRDMEAYVGRPAGFVPTSGKTINILGNANIAANATNSALATSDGIGAGGVNITTMLPTAVVTGATLAYIGPQTSFTSASINVTASDINIADADILTGSLGGITGSGANATATIDRDTEAFIDKGVTVTPGTGAVTIDAISSSTATADSLGFSGGGVSVSVMLSNATISGATRAYVAEGANITATSLDVLADATHSATAYTLTVGIAGFSGSGANATATVSGPVEAYIGTATGTSSAIQTPVNVTGATTVDATAINSATATSSGIGAGGIDVKAMLPTATVSGATRAYIKTQTGFTSGPLAITASDTNTADANALTGSLGGITGSGANATATIDRDTEAFIDKDVTVSPGTGAVTIDATSSSTATADAIGASGGAVGVSVMLSNATITGATRAYVAEGANITATSLDVGADATNSATAYTLTVGIAGFSGSGANTTATVSGPVEAYIGTETGEVPTSLTILDITGATTVDASATSNATATSSGIGAGAIDVKVMLPTATIGGATLAYIGPETGLTSGSLAIAADDTNTADANALTGSLGGITGSGATPTAAVSRNTRAFIDEDVTVEPGSGSISIDATSTSTATADAIGASGGAVSVNVMLSDATISGSTEAYIADGSEINATSLDISAVSTNDATAYTYTLGIGVISGSGANAAADVTRTNKAYIASDVTVDTGSGAVTINADSTSTATAEAEGGTGGMITISALGSDATIGGINQATIGGGTTNIQAGQLTIDVDTINTADADTTSRSISVVSGGFSDADAETTTNTTAAIYNGAQLQLSGNADITASAMNTITADANGSSAAVGAVTDLASTADSDGSVYAYMNGDLQSGVNLTLTAESIDTAKATTKAFAAGAVTVGASRAISYVSPTVTADIGGSVAISGDILVDADANTASRAYAYGTSISGLANVGESLSRAESTPVISAGISGSTISANGNVTIRATHDPNGSNAIRSWARGSAKGTSLFGEIGAHSVVDVNVSVTSQVGNNTTIIAGGDVDVISDSYYKLDVDVYVYGTSGAIVALGANQAEINVTSDVQTLIGSGADITSTGGNGVISSHSDVDTSVYVVGGLGNSIGSYFTTLFEDLISLDIAGFFNNALAIPNAISSGASVAEIIINSTAQTDIMADASLDYFGDLTVEAVTDTDIDVTAKMKSASMLAPAAIAVADVQIDADAIINAGTGASISANSLTLCSENQIDVGAHPSGDGVMADAKALGDLAAYSTAISRVDVGSSGDKSEAKIVIATDAQLTAQEQMTLKVINNPDDSTMQSRSRAKADTTTILATATASAKGDVYGNAYVQADATNVPDPEYGMRAHDLDIEAESKYKLSRGPEAEASGFIEHTKEVITYVTEEIKKYLPWPLNHIVDFISYVTKKIVTTVTWVEYSEANTNVGGSDNNTQKILLNNHIQVGYGNSKILIINEDGTKDPVSNVDATIGGGKAVVEDITFDNLGKMTLWTPGGTIEGSATIELNKGAGGVYLENMSLNDFVIGKIDMIPDGASGQFSTVGNYIATYTFPTDIELESDLVILNSTAAGATTPNSDIELTDLIDNRAGFSDINNTRGNIFATTVDALVQTADLSLMATGGSIGQDSSRLQAELYQLGDLSTQFWINATNNAYLDIKGIIYKEQGAADVPFISYGRELTGGGIVDVSFLDGGQKAFSAADASTLTIELDDSLFGINLEQVSSGSTDGYNLVTDFFTPAVDHVFAPTDVLDKYSFAVLASGKQFNFSEDHIFSTADAVIYDNEGNGDISGLDNDEIYYAVVVDADSIELAHSADEANGSTFKKAAVNSSNHIDLGYNHNFTTGEQASYHVISGGENIEGLSGGAVYYIERVNAQTLRLAKSSEEASDASFDSSAIADANDNNAINLGYNHNFVTGKKVIYTKDSGDTAVNNLSNNGVYYVAVVDADTIRLAGSYGNAFLAVTDKTKAIDIEVGSGGTAMSGGSHKIQLEIDTSGLAGNGDHAIRLHYDQNGASGSHSIVSTESIKFASAHGYADDDAVVYSDNGNTAIGSLTEDSVYYVEVIDTNTIRLKDSGDNVMNLNPATGNGSGHNISSASAIELGYDHSFKTGQAVVYNEGGSGNIGGLTSGTTYYVVEVAGSTTAIQLADSKANALTGVVLEDIMTNDGLGDSDHSFGLYFDSGDSDTIDATNDLLDLGYAHGFSTGDEVIYVNSGGNATQVGDLLSGTSYYVSFVDATHFKLAETASLAEAMALGVDVFFAEPADLGSAGLNPAWPDIVVTNTATEKSVTITFNTNAANPTTAQDLIDALAATSDADDLLDIRLTGDNLEIAEKYFGDLLSLSGTSEAASQGVYVFTNLTSIDESITLSTFVIQDGGTGPGDVTIDGGNNNIELDGILNYSAGSVEISTAGSISSTGAGQLIQSQDISLTSSASAIGDGSNSINISHSTGELDANAAEDIYIEATDSDLRVGEIESLLSVNLTANGSIINGESDLIDDRIVGTSLNLTAVNGSIGADGNAIEINSDLLFAQAETNIFLNEFSGDLNINRVVSNSGNVTLVADDGIVDANDDSNADITANSVNLIAQNGSIGAVTNHLDINSSAVSDSLVDAMATQSIYLTETAGGLRINNITATAGDIVLQVPDTAATGEDLFHVATGAVTAGNNIDFNIGDNISIYGDVTATAVLNINGDYGNADAAGTNIDIIGLASANTVYINGDDDDDNIGIINITATSPLSIVNSGNGDDNIYLGRSVAGDPADGLLSGINAPLLIDGDPHVDGDSLYLDNSADTIGASGTITADTITGFGMGSAIRYQEIENLGFEFGDGDDTVNIQSTSAGVITTINTNGGNDTINVSSNAPANTGSLDGIQGQLNVDGGEGDNTLNISDASETDDETVTITENSVSGLSPAVIYYYSNGGDFSGTVNITTGQGNDDITVESLSGNAFTIVNANDGDDTVTVGPGVSKGAFTAFGNNGNDYLDALNSGIPVSFFGGNGLDILLGSNYGDKMDGGDGSDYIFGDYGRYTTSPPGSKDPNDIIEMWTDNAPLGGDDTIMGGSGMDFIIGAGGNDFIDGGAGQDIIFGDSGVITLLNGFPVTVMSIDLYKGGNDTLIGGGGGDVMIGGFGNDLLGGLFAEDIMIGDYAYLELGNHNGSFYVLRLDTNDDELMSNTLFNLYGGSSFEKSAMKEDDLDGGETYLFAGDYSRISRVLDSSYGSAIAALLGIDNAGFSHGSTIITPEASNKADMMQPESQDSDRESEESGTEGSSIETFWHPDSGGTSSRIGRSTGGFDLENIGALIGAVAGWKVNRAELNRTGSNIAARPVQQKQRKRMMKWDDENVTLIDEAGDGDESPWHIGFKKTDKLH